MPEFGNSVLCEQGFKNVYENGEITGFQLRVRISYYRGISVAILGGYDITVDGEKFTSEDVSFSLDNKNYYTIKELGAMADLRWEYGDKAYLHVKKPGGLTPGLHTVRVVQYVDVPYLGFSTNFWQEKQLTNVI